MPVLTAAASLLTGKAGEPAWVRNLIRSAQGQAQQNLSPLPLLQPRGCRLAGDTVWAGGPTLWELEAQGLPSGVGAEEKSPFAPCS